jgi:hypothetical protein
VTAGVPHYFVRFGVPESTDIAVDVVPDGSGYYLRFVDGERWEHNGDALATTLGILVIDHLAARVPDLTILHAGVVEWEGAAFVFAGPSHSGKSRLIDAMLRAGARYLSDEYAPVNDDLDVLAWPRALGLREHDRLGAGRHSVEDLGGRRARFDRYPVAAIYLLEFDEAVAQLEISPLPAAEAVLRLLPQTFSVRTPELLERLRRLTTTVPVFRGVRGEADAAALTLLQHCTFGRVA